MKAKVNDFIHIPAWNDFGMVVDVESAPIGSDDAIVILLQSDPESDKLQRYRLEPDEYAIDTTA